MAHKPIVLGLIHVTVLRATMLVIKKGICHLSLSSMLVKDHSSKGVCLESARQATGFTTLLATSQQHVASVS